MPNTTNTTAADRTTTRRTRADRVMSVVTAHSGVTSVGLVAASTGMSIEAVKVTVRKLVAAGRVAFGWDGQALEITDAERHDIEIDQAVARISRAAR